MGKIFGVDGGGTKTHLVVAQGDGSRQQFFGGDAANHQVTNDARRNLTALFANISNQQFVVGVVCIAGWDFESDRKIARENIESALASNNIIVDTLVIENDVFAILKLGLRNDTCGVAFIAGTGTICVATDGSTLYRTYGYGYASGEWGSGYELAEYALHLISGAEIGKYEPVPILREMAFSYFKVKSVGELLESIAYQRFTYQNISQFLPSVFEAFNRQCPGASMVLNHGGREHALTIACMLKKIGNPQAPVVLAGGVYKSGILLPSFTEHLEKLNGLLPEIRIHDQPPVYGALIWAQQISS